MLYVMIRGGPAVIEGIQEHLEMSQSEVQFIYDYHIFHNQL